MNKTIEQIKKDKWTTLTGSIVKHMYPDYACPDCKQLHLKYDEDGELLYGRCNK